MSSNSESSSYHFFIYKIQIRLDTNLITLKQSLMKIQILDKLQKVKQINFLQLRNLCYLDMTNPIVVTYQIGEEACQFILSLICRQDSQKQNFDIPSDIQIIPFQSNLRNEKCMFTDLLLKTDNISQTSYQKLQIITPVYMKLHYLRRLEYGAK